MKENLKEKDTKIVIEVSPETGNAVLFISERTNDSGQKDYMVAIKAGYEILNKAFFLTREEANENFINREPEFKEDYNGKWY